MANDIIISNIVRKDDLRKVQKKILQDIASYLKTSFGPFGSNTIIKKDKDAATEYTKDGHDILTKIKYNGPIEMTIVDDLVDITKYVVKTVGDGTTSAVEMSNYIFSRISDLEATGKYSAYDIIYAFKKVVSRISDLIKTHGAECTLEDIYDIAYTSTNGNERLANNIYTLYKEYGFDIYIDLQVALTSEEDIIKIYDGMTLNSGYTDSVFANRPNATCELNHPHIYIFEDPIDTAEMINLFDEIIIHNIINPYNGKDNAEIIPTVIIAPKISRDMSACMDNLTNFIMQFPITRKPPIAIITAYTQQDEMSDIATLCGAPRIKKYINDEIHEKDIKDGKAPTLENVFDFFGSCDMVSITKDTTKIINPAKMYDENGNYTETFNNLLSWCENELEREKNENKNSKAAYDLKRRINSLKSNLIEYFVGGISIVDRDSDRALLEDAIKNCRSAITNGVGSGGNVEGFRAATELKDFANNNDCPEIEHEIIDIIVDAYRDIINLLYKDKLEAETKKIESLGNALSKVAGSSYTSFMTNEDDKEIANAMPEGFANINLYKGLIEKGAFNLRTNRFDGKVKSSIMSDIVILEAISKIIVLMATSEQFILPSPVYNTYTDINK